jgi:hypothetical protein
MKHTSAAQAAPLSSRRPRVSRPVSFNVTRFEAGQIRAIAVRYAAVVRLLTDRKVDILETVMDLTACHANGCPLDLELLAAADDTNLLHDVGGINRHMDRETGRLTRCFVPRFTARVTR